MVTLSEIAKEAGVSVMTVSNVVNGNLLKVSDATAERIRTIIKERNYVPNATARSLVRSSSTIIAIILRGGPEENSLNNPHNAALVGTMIQRIRARGYYTMVNIMAGQDDIVNSLRTWNVEGAILMGMFDDEIEAICQVNDGPMVFIDSYSDRRPLSNVGIDDYAGGRLAATYLLERGHRRIAFVGPPVLHQGVVQHRYTGFCEALGEYGVRFDEADHFVVDSDVDAPAVIAVAHQIAARHPDLTAAFATSDQIASYLIRGLHEVGLAVPADVSIIGFDNAAISTQITPALTTIAQDLDAKGTLAVDVLFARLQDPTAPPQSQTLGVTLIDRSSVRTL